MSEDFIDTYFLDGRWWNRIVVGGVDYVIAHASRDEAVELGRSLAVAARSEHIIRDRDCQVVSHTIFRSHRVEGPFASWWSRVHAS